MKGRGEIMQAYRTNPELFIQKANILKALAHPQRLCIVQKLCQTDSISVTDMQDCLGEAQPTVSQHLSKLKAAGIIIGKREGTNIYYSLYDEETKKIVRGIIDEIF
jgi:ArsR family transcriptional regulator